MNLRILALKIDDLLDYLGPKCKLFHSIMVDENKVFKNFTICVKIGHLMPIYCRVKRASGKNQAKKILRTFIFQGLIEKAKFSVSSFIPKRPQNPVFDRFFLLMRPLSNLLRQALN